MQALQQQNKDMKAAVAKAGAQGRDEKGLSAETLAQRVQLEEQRMAENEAHMQQLRAQNAEIKANLSGTGGY